MRHPLLYALCTEIAKILVIVILFMSVQVVRSCREPDLGALATTFDPPQVQARRD